MMPESNAQWAWFFFWGVGSLGGWLVLGSAQWALFTFFAVGAAGGWLVFCLIAIEAWKSFRKVRT